MNDKITLQAISDIFASQYGLSKKTTDTFGKTFFDAIVDGLNADGVVKIKGLGTFKIVEVGSRESVNVTNGERIVIEGYRKVSFVPDELAEQKQAEAIAEVETLVAQAGEQVDNKEDVSSTTEVEEAQVKEEATEEVQNEVQNESAVPEKVEVPADEFSGIDLLISTPESISEVEKDLSLARIRAEQTLEEAKKANVEYRRLEMLLERLKANVVPEKAEEEKAEVAEEKAVETVALAAVMPTAEEPITEPLPEPENTEEPEVPEEPEIPEKPEIPEIPEIPEEPEVNDQEDDEEEEEEEEEYEYEESGSNIRLWILIPLVGALLAVAGIFTYRYMKHRVPEELSLTIEQQYANKVANRIQIESTEHADTTKKKQQEDAEVKAKLADEAKAKAEKEAAEKKAAEEKAIAEKKAAEEKAKAEKEAAEKKAAEAKAKAEKANKPKVHTMMKGENLYQISKKYYGTFDSVRSIIRINKFPDPNNVPIGQEIKLP